MRQRRRTPAPRLDVWRIAHHEIRSAGRERRDVADVGAHDVDAMAPVIRACVRLGELGERRIDLDHRHVLGCAEMEQRQTDRAHSCAEIERCTRAPLPCGKRREEHGIDVHTIAATARGLGERDQPSEEGIPSRARYFCHGRRPRKLSAVTAPGNVWTTCVPRRTVCPPDLPIALMRIG